MIPAECQGALALIVGGHVEANCIKIDDITMLIPNVAEHVPGQRAR